MAISLWTCLIPESKEGPACLVLRWETSLHSALWRHGCWIKQISISLSTLPRRTKVISGTDRKTKFTEMNFLVHAEFLVKQGCWRKSWLQESSGEHSWGRLPGKRTCRGQKEAAAVKMALTQEWSFFQPSRSFKFSERAFREIQYKVLKWKMEKALK